MAADEVMVGVASIPEREVSLRQTIASLAPQADRIAVSLNDYPKIPGWLAKFPNVEPTLRPTNHGDAEKFAMVDGWDGIVATCDDDLLYPTDYVDALRAGLDRYSGRAVSFHGGVTLGWNGAAVAASHKRFRCLDEQPDDDPAVNVVGTGVLAYHTSQVPVWADAFPLANMADVQFACHARTLGLQLACLAHRRRWLRDICPQQGRRIYEANRDHDGSTCDTNAQRERLIRSFDWTQPARRQRIRVMVATCSRPQQLLELLEDLEVQSGWCDLEVCVYEDPTAADYTTCRDLCERRGWDWRRFPRRLGREGYWKLVEHQFRDANQSAADWFLFLPDDVRLNRHAIAKAVTLWWKLEEPAALTLWRLASLDGQASWTGRRPVQHQHATEVFHLDGLFLCRRETLDRLRWRIVDPKFQHGTGSGVGGQLSRRLHRQAARMYRVDRSLVRNNDGGVSVMNPVERERNPTVLL